MLHRFALSSPFRVLSATPFERDGEKCTFGRTTVVYGRNGSGKTTLSEALRRAVADVDDAETTSVTAHFGPVDSPAQVALTADTHAALVFVYNKHYVEDTLRMFLDGRGESPSILKLGAANVAAAERLDRVRGRLGRMELRLASIRSTRTRLVKERDALEKEVKNEIIASLVDGDPGSYNSARYRVDKVRAALTDPDCVELASEELIQEVDTANAPTIESLAEPSWPGVPETLRQVLNNELLGGAVDSQAVPRLLEDPHLAKWVREGVAMHRPDDTCKFCGTGVATVDLLRTYALHFSEALKALEDRLEKAIAHFTGMLADLSNLQTRWPSEENILPLYRQRFAEKKVLWLAHSQQLTRQVEEALRLLVRRAENPSSPLPDDERVGEPFAQFDESSLNALWRAHNDDCMSQEARKRQAQSAVEGHFAAVSSHTYQLLVNRIALAERADVALHGTRVRWLRDEIELEQSQDDTGRMANLIDADLQEHFGLSHLRVVVSSDQKGYVVRRGDKDAERLSEGERNAIALSYFLRSLQAEGVDPKKTVVVIDDPVTSLDKEALFAAFALVQERTRDFCQVVILTHDFEYFRLLVGHTKSRREKSEKKVRGGDRAEASFPAVAVLEVVASTDSEGLRSSALRKVPRELLQHPSEYHFLFRRVLDGIAGLRRDELPLLGNAARRLVDGFMSFRVPQGNDFQARADLLVAEGAIDAVLARRVVTFMHGQSHREEPRPTSALDFPAVEEELSAVMEFIRAADPRHFSAMCKAVGAAEPDLAA